MEAELKTASNIRVMEARWRVFNISTLKRNDIV